MIRFSFRVLVNFLAFLWCSMGPLTWPSGLWFLFGGVSLGGIVGCCSFRFLFSGLVVSVLSFSYSVFGVVGVFVFG